QAVMRAVDVGYESHFFKIFFESHFFVSGKKANSHSGISVVYFLDLTDIERLEVIPIADVFRFHDGHYKVNKLRRCRLKYTILVGTRLYFYVVNDRCEPAFLSELFY